MRLGTQSPTLGGHTARATDYRAKEEDRHQVDQNSLLQGNCRKVMNRYERDESHERYYGTPPEHSIPLSNIRRTPQNIPEHHQHGLNTTKIFLNTTNLKKATNISHST
jgi:hypothetical protein